MNEIFFVEKIVKPLWVTIDNFLGNNFQKELDNIELNLNNWKEKLKIENEETK